jgi:ADP-heptose:LPS heptosyltransferase
LGYIICYFHFLFHWIPRRKKRILIIKNDGIGDVLLFLPYLQKIREHYSAPEWHLSVAVIPVLYPLIQRAEIADQVIIYPKYRNSVQWTIFRLWFWLTTPADIVVNGSCVGDEVLPVYPSEKNISVRMGVSAPEKNTIINVEDMTIHEWNQTILTHLGIMEKPSEFDYSRFCDPIPAEWIHTPYILICPEASNPGKCWESYKFSILIDKLSETFPQKLIILVGTNEEAAQKIIDQCDNKTSIVNLCGKTTLFQLFTLVRDADFLISNDTGTAHIGALVGKKTFIICGKGHYGIFVPYPPGQEGRSVFSIFSKTNCSKCYWINTLPECRCGTYRCISEITVDEVLQTIKNKLEFK